ncbi:thioesterase II family protein [Paenarthrobacter sp. NCHU4564]|uniref:thioesterase II family protein n=1 Tax=Paenarthrobacter sp. NCHU4564 TaxID=3451353 RepID=UPI003F99B305
MHLFCLHHAGGTTASFAGWRFQGVTVTKAGYRGRNFASFGAAADSIASRVQESRSPRIALYGHSMGAVLAFEVALRLQESGTVAHVFLAAARPPSGFLPVTPDAGAAATGKVPAAVWADAVVAEPGVSGTLSERALEVLQEDLALLGSYQGRPPARQLEVPATVLVGRDDPVVPASESARWADWCTAAPPVVEAGRGHLFHVGNPAVMRLVETTLAEPYQDQGGQQKARRHRMSPGFP